ncbi:hypothetical protein [Niabella beijingensis]|uniref:hypothetical protein n=1 Tax=Niabella beijingensis TaxID=2872700 RepID=UPI001CBD24C0|nr:hypothetical protein [Niabella beijingensis]MBZ4189049.1 hypothetical protein [Niabella beijingensis]
MKFYPFVLLLLMLASCGTQRKLATAKASSARTQQLVSDETQQLDAIKKILDVKAADRSIDSVLNNDVQKILNKLNGNLSSVQQLALIMDAATKSRSAFRRGIRSTDLLSKLVILDSFNTARKRREEVYTMLNESVSTSKYQMFHYAAFFGPGVYRVPGSAMNNVRAYFTPIIDSLSRVSNKYSNIAREARIVFVGYSDLTPVTRNGPLYKEMTDLLHTTEPSQQEMNQLLSDLRAKEMVRNMKLVMESNTSKFENYNTLKIGYVAYGKGEEYPSPSIRDYKSTDERRRIVISYWTVLPKLQDL